jgi:hypothetical protein
MELIINLENENCRLELTQNGSAIDAEKFSYYHDLDDQLITHIDKLVKRNKIDVSAVSHYKILGNLGENAISLKIAEAVVEGLKV